MRPIDADAFEEEARNSLDMQDLYLPIHIKELVIDDMPTVDAVPVIRCKDCKHFEYDNVEKVDGIPLIVAHEICKRWGKGCKTSENGWCFLAERKEE